MNPFDTQTTDSYYADKRGQDVKPVFISVDPHRDTIDQVKFYLKGLRFA